ncbi:MAG: CvpA family protein [Paramuribaculum sp.]|nr:CvpA family protein [Paramuribaculum sp.]
MGWIDIFLIIMLAGACILGYSEGLIGQLTTISGVLLGIVAVWILGDPVTRFTAMLMGVDWQTATAFKRYSAAVIGCGTLFFIIWGSIWYVGRILRKTLKTVHLNVFNSLCGSLFMVFKWSLVVSLILNLWYVIWPSSPIFFSSRMFDGKMFRFVMDLGPWLMGYIREAATNSATAML